MIPLTTSTSTAEFLKLSPNHKNCVHQSKCKTALANTGFQLEKTLVERTLEKCQEIDSNECCEPENTENS